MATPFGVSGNRGLDVGKARGPPWALKPWVSAFGRLACFAVPGSGPAQARAKIETSLSLYALKSSTPKAF